MEKRCERCRAPGAGRDYLVQSHRHDPHPVIARLCPSCVTEAVEGRAVVTRAELAGARLAP